jgi:hypothetical protein
MSLGNTLTYPEEQGVAGKVVPNGMRVLKAKKADGHDVDAIVDTGKGPAGE